MELEIRNADLTPDLVPDSAEEAAAMEEFALSFDGYAFWGDQCAALAEAVAETFHDEGTLPADLSELRACLFYEHQRWHWTRGSPDPASRAYLQALLDRIRAAVASN